MKYQLLLLLLILGGYTQECEGQNKLQPLKEFNNDTMAYMKKNYDGGMLYRRGKTIGHVLEDAEVPFKSYIIAETRDNHPSIGFIILFTQSAEEVRALFKAGKPVYGVFCDLGESYLERETIYKILVRLGTNRFNDLKKSDAKVLKDIKIAWAEFCDQEGWCSMYKVE